MSSTTHQEHAHDDHGHGGGHGDHHGGPDHVPHVTPLSTYFLVFLTLIVLTVITVGVSYFDFGGANLFIALFVATIKGTVVAAWFMHLKGDERMNSVLLASAFLFLAIFIGLTAIDLLQRGHADPDEARRVYNLQQPFDVATNQPRKGVKVTGHGKPHVAGHGGAAPTDNPVSGHGSAPAAPPGSTKPAGGH
jgi:cytochrome c oxidase subunit 4